MGRGTAREAGTPVDQRPRRGTSLHVCRYPTAHRSGCILLCHAGHRTGRHGDAHPEAPHRVVDQHSGPPQTGCRCHSRHTHAHPSRHRLSQQCRLGEGHHLCRRPLRHWRDREGAARKSHCRDNHRREWPESQCAASFPRFPYRGGECARLRRLAGDREVLRVELEARRQSAYARRHV